MIRPIQKKKDMYGVQGFVGFDPAKPDTDIRLYKEIEKFLQGDMGLGGSGGTLANKLKTAKSYQASHVFGSRGDRDIATERLDQQLTYFLNTQLGDAAKAAKMTVPGYLQSKGIHGISQIGTGDDAKYSAYRRDDFLQVSQNPVTGSTEKLVKAYMKGIGAAFNTSGGTNENRRLTALLRPDEAAYVNKKIKDTAKRVNAGEYPKGDLEAFYASTSQREELRNKIKTSKNERAEALVNDPDSPVMAELKSKIKLQDQQKKAYNLAYKQLVDEGEIDAPEAPMDVKTKIKLKEKQKKEYNLAKQQLIADGEIAPDEEKKKEEKNKTGRVASQAMLLVINNIKNITTMVSSMVGVLKKIAMDLGRVLQTSSANNIDPNTADRMRRWGAANKGYTGGNDYLLLDAVSSVDAKYGYAERLDNLASGLNTTLSEKYARPIIDVTTELYKTKDPLGATKKVFGSFATMYMNAQPGKARNEELRSQLAALEQAFDKTVAEAYRAMLTAALAHGRINKKNAGSLFDIELRTAGILSSGVAAKTYTGESHAGVNIVRAAKDVNDVLGDFAKLQISLIRTLLEHTNEIKNILSNIAGGILLIMEKFGVPGADRLRKKWESAEKQRANTEYNAHLTATAQLGNAAENSIISYLKAKKSKNIEADTKEIFNAVSIGAPLPDKYKDFATKAEGKRAIDYIATYQVGVSQAKENYKEMRKGVPTVAGDLYSIFSDSVYEINKLREIYGTPPDAEITDAQIISIQNTKLKEKQANVIKEILQGKREATKEQLKKQFMQKMNEGTAAQRTALTFFFNEDVEGTAEKMAENAIKAGKNIKFDGLFNDAEKEILDKNIKQLQDTSKLFKQNDNGLLFNPDFQRIASINNSSFFDSSTKTAKGASATEQDQDKKVTMENIVALKINGKEIFNNTETNNEAAQRRYWTANIMVG